MKPEKRDQGFLPGGPELPLGPSGMGTATQIKDQIPPPYREEPWAWMHICRQHIEQKDCSYLNPPAGKAVRTLEEKHLGLNALTGAKTGSSQVVQKIPTSLVIFWELWSVCGLIFPLLFSVSCLVVSDSLQLHRLYPTKLLCPWDSPGKNNGVGCHFLLQGLFPM